MFNLKSLILGYILISLVSCMPSKSELEQLKGKQNQEYLAKWQDQKFSMFIHWGLYSIPAGIWDGERITGYSEQIKGHARISTEEYRELTSAFNPTMWNADSIALLAMEAGMKSIIITAKHHDGFCMFASEYTPFNVLDATPYKKDIVKDLAEACKRHDLKFGVYFSLIDWDYADALPFTSVRNSDSIPPLHHEYNLNQIRELLTNYGEITELWFDMGAPTYEQSKEIALLVKKLQPNCLVSGRIWNDQGDFMVMGDNYQPEFKMGIPWQSPASMFRETWSYRSWQERPSVETKINEKLQDLVKVVSSGGNYLLNIGPKADGTVVLFEKQVLKGIGEWLEKNGKSIYETKELPFSKQEWGFITSKPGKLYLHTVNYPENNKLTIQGLKTDISKAYPLSDPVLLLNSKNTNNICEIELSEKIVRDKYITVIVLEYKGELLYTPANSIELDENGEFILTSNNAETYHSYSGHDYYSSKPTVVKMKW
ncbi:MAG: alpha-L-fucosidase [Bacteroidales bacterium]|nr:alpha-L-fucosidase [Bacteroidales bacterium]MDY0198216.1 alpha-L-fucosidase [Tenuifilaceae bacterium]